MSQGGAVVHPPVKRRNLLRTERRIQLVKMFSMYHASVFITSVEPIEVSRDSSFPKVDVYAFSSIIFADGRQEKVTRLE